MRILFCWVGRTDLNHSRGEALGSPIYQALRAREIDEVVLLCNYEEELGQHYRRWLADQFEVDIQLYDESSLDSPMNFESIYRRAVQVVDAVRREKGGRAEFIFHVSPGTSVMAAIWIILAKTRYAATLIKSSREQGVQELSVPIAMSAEFIADLARSADERLLKASEAKPGEAAEFGDIIYRSPKMQRLIGRARLVAPRDVPVLIQGESGTGKELLARAIHKKSLRSRGPFVAVNCGAIPAELVESELFGHKKGAFTGASADRAGHFRAANKGTLFLDEIGEMPLSVQVKLLRALQEEKVTPVGASKEEGIDIRVIAATNRVLYEEVREERFREDLFHRLAVAVLDVPPLRAREGDLSLLLDRLMEEIHGELAQPGEEKTLTPEAKSVFLDHSWPGNIRELRNSLLRAFVWTVGERIEMEDAESALLSAPSSNAGILDRSLEGGLDIDEVLNEVQRHYIERALKMASSKSEAATLLGLSRQTLTNRMKNVGLET